MSGPVRLHPENHKRFLWRGKATFLLGSTEHYGALLNAAFDFERYLDTVASAGLNTTRVFAFYRQLESSNVGLGYANPLAPRPERYLAPWARAGAEHGLGPDGLPRFDLDTWDERYFARLRRLLSAADARGVVVELVFFCSQYNEECWLHSPLHPAGNVNGVGRGVRTWRDFLTHADPAVAEHQRRLVRKLVTETNAFDNLYYEICNEPAYADKSGPRPDLVRDWQRGLVATVRETERALPKRHLVAVNPNQLLPARDPNSPGETAISVLDDGYYQRDPEIDFVNVHYISHRAPQEGLSHDYAGGARPRHRRSYRFGRLTAFTILRSAGKPIGFNEDYSGYIDGLPPRPVQARQEAWESLLAGCVAYDHLDRTFTPDDPIGSAAGATPGGLPREWSDGRPLRRQLGHVLTVAAATDLATLRPDPLAVAHAPPGTGSGRGAHPRVGAHNAVRLPRRPPSVRRRPRGGRRRREARPRGAASAVRGAVARPADRCVGGGGPGRGGRGRHPRRARAPLPRGHAALPGVVRRPSRPVRRGRGRRLGPLRGAAVRSADLDGTCQRYAERNRGGAP